MSVHIDHLIAPAKLLAMSFSPSPPVILDVRRRPAFEKSDSIIAGARWIEHLSVGNIADQLKPERLVVTYCVHGHQVSQSAAALLRSHNLNSVALEGGIDGWTDIDGPVLSSKIAEPFVDRPWVACCRPDPDELAGCWLLRRYLSRTAPLYFVERDRVDPVAEELGAMSASKDIRGHGGGQNIFDSMISHFGIHDPALHLVSKVLRGDAMLAIHTGLSHLHQGVDLADEFGRVCDALVQTARGNTPSAHAGRARVATHD